MKGDGPSVYIDREFLRHDYWTLTIDYLNFLLIFEFTPCLSIPKGYWLYMVKVKSNSRTNYQNYYHNESGWSIETMVTQRVITWVIRTVSFISFSTLTPK